MLLLSSADFFQKFLSGALSRVLNRLYQDQDGCSVSPYMGHNCLQRLTGSADGKRRELRLE